MVARGRGPKDISCAWGAPLFQREGRGAGGCCLWRLWLSSLPREPGCHCNLESYSGLNGWNSLGCTGDRGSEGKDPHGSLPGVGVCPQCPPAKGKKTLATQFPQLSSDPEGPAQEARGRRASSLAPFIPRSPSKGGFITPMTLPFMSCFHVGRRERGLSNKPREAT